MVHRRWVPYCHSPLFSDLLHPEDGPSQGPHELPANPIHSSYGRLALGTAFTAGYKLPSARAITRSIAVHMLNKVYICACVQTSEGATIRDLALPGRFKALDSSILRMGEGPRQW